MRKHLLTALLVCLLCMVTEVSAQASGFTLSERTAETITLTYDGDALLAAAAYSEDGRMLETVTSQHTVTVPYGEGYVRAFALDPVTYAPLSPAWDSRETEGKKVLVACFSYTGSTMKIAGHIASALDADLFRITAAEPYTDDILNYYDPSTRAYIERYDDSARPAIAGELPTLDDYDVIFVGYPIWYGRAPKIIRTFLESGSFSDKTVIPFCTSVSSSIDNNELRASAPDALWRSGRRFSSGASRETVVSWLDSFDLE